MNMEKIPTWMAGFLSRMRTDVCAAKVIKDGTKRAMQLKEPLTKQRLSAHFDPEQDRWYGGYPMQPGSSSTLMVMWDVDDHDGSLGKEEVRHRAELIMREVRSSGREPGLYISSGGKGLHVYVFWQRPQDAYSVRQWAKEVLQRAGLEDKAGVVEVFPKQDHVPEGGYGNPIFFPREQLMPHREDNPDVPLRPRAVKPAGKVRRGRAMDPVDALMVREALEHIPAEDYDDWIKVGMCLYEATEGGAEGLEMWEAWSRTADNYEPGVCQEKWDTFRQKADGVSLGSLFHMARMHGWDHREGQNRRLEAQLSEISKTLSSVVRKDYIPDDGPVPGPVTIDRVLENLPPPFWLIQGVIRRGDVIGIIGHPGSGKTVISLDMALRVSMGMDVHGRKTARQRVAYLASENPDEVYLRVKLWCQYHGISPRALRGWFDLRSGSYDMAEPRVVEALSQSLQDENVPLGLLVVDTFSANFFGTSENDATEVMQWFNTLRMGLISRLGCAVIVLGHPVKDGDEIHVWRGSGAIQGTLDATFGVEARNDAVVLSQGKRRGPPCRDIIWSLKQIEVAGLVDNFGDAVTSVVADAPVVGSEGMDALTMAVCLGIKRGVPLRGIARMVGRHPQVVARLVEKLKKSSPGPRVVSERQGELHLTVYGETLAEMAAEREDSIMRLLKKEADDELDQGHELLKK
jgi:hypothetical protein